MATRLLRGKGIPCSYDPPPPPKVHGEITINFRPIQRALKNSGVLIFVLSLAAVIVFAAFGIYKVTIRIQESRAFHNAVLSGK